MATRFLILILAFAVQLAGCGLADSLSTAINDATSELEQELEDLESLAPEPINQYAGLGSYWKIAHNVDDRFELQYSEYRQGTTLGTVTGSWNTLDTGIVELTVESGTGEFEDVPEGLVAYGLEVPGTLFVLSVPDDDTLIYMPAVDACPTDAFESNALAIQPGTMIYDDGQEVMGTVDIDPSAGKGTIQTHTFGPDVDTVHDQDQFSFDCDDGELTIEADQKNESDGVLTNSGIGVVDSGGGVLLTPQDTQLSLGGLAGTYTALVYSDNGTDETVEPYQLIFGADGKAEARLMEDAEGTVSDDTVTLAFRKLPAGAPPGSMEFSILDDLNTTDRGYGYSLAVQNLANSGKNFIAGIGQDESGSGSFFYFAVER